MLIPPRDSVFHARYHVPRSQVWEASGGRESGCVHLHVREQFDFGRIHRSTGQALCGKRGWYERECDDGERLCPRCKSISERWAAVQAAPVGFRLQIVVSGGEARALLFPDSGGEERSAPLPVNAPCSGPRLRIVPLPNGMDPNDKVGYGTF